MDKFWVVTFDRNIDSYWVAEREVVAAYIDSKPSKPGRGRNSIDVHSKWKFEPIHTFTSVEEKAHTERLALMRSAIAKFTPEERVVFEEYAAILKLAEDAPVS